MSLNYFKKILMSGLNVKEKATLEEELNSLGEGGSANAVQYTPQNLTSEQKTQVCKNIGLPYEGDALHIDIEWDGNTSGRAQLTFLEESELSAYKVAEFSEGLNMNALAGGQIYMSDGENISININMFDNYDDMLSVGETVFIVPEAGVYDDYYVFPESGIYFSWSNEDEYVSELFVEQPSRIINKIPQSHVEQHDVFMIDIDEAYENASLVTDPSIAGSCQTDIIKFIDKTSHFENILGIDYDIVIRRINSTQSTQAIFKAAAVEYTYSRQEGTIRFYDHLLDEEGYYSVNRISLQFKASDFYNGQTEMFVYRDGYSKLNIE